MTMTQLQRDALARAKAGEWELADAMELVERSRANHVPRTVVDEFAARELDNEDIGAIGGVFANGRMRLIGYGKPTCNKCQGDGEVECDHCGHTGDCKECDGTGGGDGVIQVFTDLNDTVVPEGNEPQRPAIIRPISWAQKILAAYHKEQHAQRHAAKTLENA
ncbi:hypothetical protein LJR168_001979 [Pseudoxanthomonas sp. LjRoot168]|uniref:hypothetical protein n=1 Tax=unclassified Pseudoxanthomonas TaxID=2645906 RepID=UPI003ECD5CAE